MTVPPTLGELEQVALMAVWRLGPEAYGLNIRDEIAVWTGRSLSVSAVYVTLMRLQRKGLVTSTMAAPTPVRGGKSKRFFRVEPPGVRALKHAREVMERMWAGWEVSPHPGRRR